MRSKRNREEDGCELVRIRVKERIDRKHPNTGIRSGEKLLLIVLGACLGLGIGFLLAGKLVSYLRKPLNAGVKVDWRVEPGRISSDKQQGPVVTDIEFDLPSEGN